MLLGLVLGTLLGITAHLTMSSSPLPEVVLRYVAQPVGQIFLRLLFMLVVPLIFSGAGRSASPGSATCGASGGSG